MLAGTRWGVRYWQKPVAGYGILHWIAEWAILAAASSIVLQSGNALGQPAGRQTGRQIGIEVGVPDHLADDREFHLSLPNLITYGKTIFSATWTEQDGGGRPLSKGTGRGDRLAIGN